MVSEMEAVEVPDRHAQGEADWWYEITGVGGFGRADTGEVSIMVVNKVSAWVAPRGRVWPCGCCVGGVINSDPRDS